MVAFAIVLALHTTLAPSSRIARNRLADPRLAPVTIATLFLSFIRIPV